MRPALVAVVLLGAAACGSSTPSGGDGDAGSTLGHPEAATEGTDGDGPSPDGASAPDSSGVAPAGLCRSDADCGNGSCSRDQVCPIHPIPVCLVLCQTDQDCAGCDQSPVAYTFCQGGTCHSTACASDADCHSGYCVKATLGFCQPALGRCCY